jgi:hypothetical protein
VPMDRVAAMRAKSDAAPAMKDCPYCLESVPAAATRCRACTSQFGAAAA